MPRSSSRILAVAGLAVAGIAVALGAALAVSAATVEDELATVRGAVAKYHSIEAAEAAGWILLPGLDHCFENPGVGGMGVHYINPALLDTTVDELQPEALVYQHLPNGKLHLGAVEYIVPAAGWDDEGHGGPPEAFGQTFHLNEPLGVYVLHAWLFTRNPAGTFEDWNPEVACPA